MDFLFDKCFLRIDVLILLVFVLMYFFGFEFGVIFHHFVEVLVIFVIFLKNYCGDWTNLEVSIPMAVVSGMCHANRLELLLGEGGG